MDSTLLQKYPLPAYRLRIRVWIIVWLLYFYSRWFVYDNYYSRLDHINFLIHEAGHPLMGMFGDMAGVWWWSLFQRFVPLSFFVYFFVRRANIAWQISLFWVGQSLLYSSIYIADANKLVLPLRSDNWIHDWWYILGNAWLIQYADTIWTSVFILGSALIFVALWVMALDAKHRAEFNIWLPQ